jgi:hypothetical protein
VLHPRTFFLPEVTPIADLVGGLKKKPRGKRLAELVEQVSSPNYVSPLDDKSKAKQNAIPKSRKAK